MIDKPKFKKLKSIDINTLDAGGKLPPQAPELEEAILGAIMLEKESLKDAFELLRVKHFYVDAHQYIFNAMLDLYSENHPVDILTVSERLRSKGQLEAVGGSYYIAKLTSRVSSAANLMFHAHIVIQKFIQREVISISGESIVEAYDESADAFKVLDETERKLYELKMDGMKRSYQDISSIITQAISQIEANHEKQDGITGVPSGLKALDHITAGFQKSDLIILAARPGTGKTALALTMLRNASITFHKPVAFFSLEMSATQLVTRLIAAESGISGEKLKKGNLETHEWDILNSKIKTLSNAKIYIDDTPSLRVFDLKAKCRRLHSKHNIEMIVVDYLQLMRGEDSNNKNGNREQEISYISRSLKGLAKELNVPILALAQLSRAVENRTGNRPVLSDLRESGSIEQDADMVMFIYRPSYNSRADSKDVDQNLPEDYAEIMVAKHRNGPVDDAQVRYVSHLARFEDVNEAHLYESVEGQTTKTFSSKLNDFKDNIDSQELYNLGKNNLDEPKIENDFETFGGDEDTGANIDEVSPFE